MPCSRSSTIRRRSARRSGSRTEGHVADLRPRRRPSGRLGPMTRSGPRDVPAWLETATALAWRILVVVAALLLAVLALSRLTAIVIPLIGGLFGSAIPVPP